jgi:aspartyl/asparaginyl beta-hydroxylase (cupin superfamily)
MGQAWVFDDTIEHEAWNDANQVRTILIFDVWNPYLTDVERELVSLMMRAKNAYGIA